MSDDLLDPVEGEEALFIDEIDAHKVLDSPDNLDVKKDDDDTGENGHE